MLVTVSFGAPRAVVATTCTDPLGLAWSHMLGDGRVRQGRPPSTYDGSDTTAAAPATLVARARALGLDLVAEPPHPR